MCNDKDQSDAAANCITSFVLRKHLFQESTRKWDHTKTPRKYGEQSTQFLTPLKAHSQKKITNTAKRRKETKDTPPVVTAHTERHKYIYNFHFLTLKTVYIDESNPFYGCAALNISIPSSLKMFTLVRFQLHWRNCEQSVDRLFLKRKMPNIAEYRGIKM